MVDSLRQDIYAEDTFTAKKILKDLFYFHIIGNQEVNNSDFLLGLLSRYATLSLNATAVGTDDNFDLLYKKTSA